MYKSEQIIKLYIGGKIYSAKESTVSQTAGAFDFVAQTTTMSRPPPMPQIFNRCRMSIPFVFYFPALLLSNVFVSDYCENPFIKTRFIIGDGNL